MKLNFKSIVFGLLYILLQFNFSAAFSQITERPAGTTKAPWGYVEYLPDNYYTSPNKKFPLIIHLSGSGETGNGTTDLYKVTKHGPLALVKSGNWPVRNRKGIAPSEHFVIIGPQSSGGFFAASKLKKLVDLAIDSYRIDPNRIYVMGLSSGAYSVWSFVANYPDVVAAAIPISGSGRSAQANACEWKDVPVWAFHGDSDGTVGISGSINPINSVRSCTPAGNPGAKLTVYPGVGHNAWTRTYNLSGIDSGSPDYDPFNMSIYDWLLTYSRGSGTEVNQTPTISAGADKTIQLPTKTLVLSGTASDADGYIELQQWSKQSGPTCSIESEYSTSTTVSNLLQGTYVFRFWAKDNDGATAYDDVTVTVQEGGINQAPTVSAGTDKTIQLPTNTLVLSGTASDPDGNIEVNRWSKQSGPACTIQSEFSASTTVSNMVQGTYVFRFWAKDNDGAAAYDDVTVTVQEGGINQAPTVSAGTDKTIQLPTNTLVLSGTAVDPDGNIEVNRWSKQSGPTCTIESEYSTSTTVYNLLQGTYVFRFWAKDNDGAAAYDDVTVTVQEGGINQAPTVSAGTDKTIQLPTNTLVLSGTASDPDGNIEVNRWSKQSGPAGTIEDEYSAITTVSNLVQGTYVFRFWAKDNDGAAAYDDVTVTVQEDGINQAPTVSAGTDKTIQVPTNTLVLSGTAVDPDGNIEVNRWSKQSGPSCTIESEFSAKTTVSNLVEGTYVFRFWAKNNNGAAAYDDVIVIVQSSSNPIARKSAKGEDINSFEKLSEKPIIYPNPVSDKLNIKIPKNLLDNHEKLNFKLIDLMGNIIKDRSIDLSGMISIDVTELKNTTYVYFISSNDLVLFRNKLVKISD